MATLVHQDQDHVGPWKRGVSGRHSEGRTHLPLVVPSCLSRRGEPVGVIVVSRSPVRLGS